jgi:hypothetical protein
MQVTNNDDKRNAEGNNDAENTSAALQQAEKDISKDPELSSEPDPAADLDEGELARLEGED